MTRRDMTGHGGTQRIRDIGWDKEHAAGPKAVGSDGKTGRGSLKAPHEQSGSRRGTDKERARSGASAHHPGRCAQPRGRGGRRCPPAPPWRPAERPIVEALRRSAWLSKRTVRLLVARLSLRLDATLWKDCGREGRGVYSTGVTVNYGGSLDLSQLFGPAHHGSTPWALDCLLPADAPPL